jgi:pimeloyl-ACP methyl ester carboxylesterase
MSRSAVKFVDTSYGRLAYRTGGDAAGVPLLLNQRYRGTMEDWDPAFIQKLAENRRVIRFDSAGVGLSAGERPVPPADRRRLRQCCGAARPLHRHRSADAGHQYDHHMHAPAHRDR